MVSNISCVGYLLHGFITVMGWTCRPMLISTGLDSTCHESLPRLHRPDQTWDERWPMCKSWNRHVKPQKMILGWGHLYQSKLRFHCPVCFFPKDTWLKDLLLQVAGGTDIVSKTLAAFCPQSMSTKVVIDIVGYDTWPALAVLEE